MCESVNCVCYFGIDPESKEEIACWENHSFWKPQVPNTSMALAVALRSDPPADDASSEAKYRWEVARDDTIGLELGLHRTYAQHQCILRALHYLDTSTAAHAAASAPDEVCKPPECFVDPTGVMKHDFYGEELFECDQKGVQNVGVRPAARCATPSAHCLIVYPSPARLARPRFVAQTVVGYAMDWLRMNATWQYDRPRSHAERPPRSP